MLHNCALSIFIPHLYNKNIRKLTFANKVFSKLQANNLKKIRVGFGEREGERGEGL